MVILLLTQGCALLALGYYPKPTSWVFQKKLMEEDSLPSKRVVDSSPGQAKRSPGKGQVNKCTLEEGAGIIGRTAESSRINLTLTYTLVPLITISAKRGLTTPSTVWGII